MNQNELKDMLKHMSIVATQLVQCADSLNKIDINNLIGCAQILDDTIMAQKTVTNVSINYFANELEYIP